MSARARLHLLPPPCPPPRLRPDPQNQRLGAGGRPGLQAVLGAPQGRR